MKAEDMYLLRQGSTVRFRKELYEKWYSNPKKPMLNWLKDGETYEIEEIADRDLEDQDRILSFFW